MAACLISIPAILAVAIGHPVTSVARSYSSIRIPSAPPMPETTYVYDRHGRLLSTLHAGIDRTPVPLSKISINLRTAVVALEDRNFYREAGISLQGIARAALVNLRSGSIEQGGSTLTQQYVKITYTGDERTLARKIREAMLATKLAETLSKDQILERYLNAVFFGHGAYGAEAAARTYFDKHAADLSVIQSATLAGIIRAPALYDPYVHPGAARLRRNLALQEMAEQGYISSSQADRLSRKPIRLHPGHDGPVPAAYFMDVVRRELQHRYGVARTFSGGLRVSTTLDRSMQADAERAIAGRLRQPTDPAAALVAMDPRTGEVLALVGGRNFTKVKFNLATQAHRQAGSAFKPFTLMTALLQGYDPHASLVGPHDLTIPNPECMDPTKTPPQPWTVSNAADGEAGTFSILDATAHSVNTIFAQLVVDVGPGNVAKTAHRLGIRSDLQPVCSITLGSQGVTPLDMTAAYSTFASGGIRHAPETIRTVRSSGGATIDRIRSSGRRVVPEQLANVVTYALEGVVQRGTGTAANFGRPVAGKTGTAQNYQDAWFCGYTPQLAACVWMGYPKTEDRPMTNVEGFSSVFGGTLPALIWHDFMAKALAGAPVLDFAPADFTGLTVQPARVIPLAPPPPPSPSPSPQPSPSPSPTRCHPHKCGGG